MKKYLLWLIPIGLVLYFLSKKAPAAPPTAATNTGTATAPKPFWSGWDNKSSKAINNTTASVNKYWNDAATLYTGVSGLFGTKGGATGPAGPTTSGSGSGSVAPADYSTAFNDLWSLAMG